MNETRTQRNTGIRHIQSRNAVGYLLGCAYRAMEDDLMTEAICEDCGLPISICNARAMLGEAIIRNGNESVKVAISDMFDAIEAEQCAVVNADKGSIDIVMAICEETEGEWEPTIAGSYRILEAALSSLTIRPAAEVAADAKAEAIEAAKDAVSGSCFALPGSTSARSYNRGVRDSIEEIDALHAPATRAALKRMKGGE